MKPVKFYLAPLHSTTIKCILVFVEILQIVSLRQNVIENLDINNLSTKFLYKFYLIDRDKVEFSCMAVCKEFAEILNNDAENRSDMIRKMVLTWISWLIFNSSKAKRRTCIHLLLKSMSPQRLMSSLTNPAKSSANVLELFLIISFSDLIFHSFLTSTS